MPAHQVLSLTAYIFKVSHSMSVSQANKIYSMDQSELLNLWAGIGTLTFCWGWYNWSLLGVIFIMILILKIILISFKNKTAD